MKLAGLTGYVVCKFSPQYQMETLMEECCASREKVRDRFALGGRNRPGIPESELQSWGRDHWVRRE